MKRTLRPAGVISLLLMLSLSRLSAQEDSTLGPIEVDFLFNYYTQDGEHSAVTGGMGTQKLSDYAGRILVNVPLDSTSRLVTNVMVNYYTSASTDNIDSYVSSASAQDARAQVSLNYTHRPPGKRWSWNLLGGGSIESDYFSGFVGGGLFFPSRDQNQIFQIQAQAFFDRWVVIFPEELRAPGMVSVPTDKRHSFSLDFSFHQVINPRLQIALNTGIIWQNGLLSTPFHRVYFRDNGDPNIETLPLDRVKFPLGIMANAFPIDWLILRAQYRFYIDSWGMVAHTAALEAPLHLIPFLNISPFYRFHHQSAVRYFQPYGGHDPAAEYFTSDFDLSGLDTHHFGLGLRFSPLYGLLRFGQSRSTAARWQDFELRLARYQRSDGLRALMVSFDFGFRL